MDLIISEPLIFILGKNNAEMLAIAKNYNSESVLSTFIMTIPDIEERYGFKRFKQNKAIEYLASKNILKAIKTGECKNGTQYELNSKALIKLDLIVSLYENKHRITIKNFVKENLSATKIMEILKNG